MKQTQAITAILALLFMTACGNLTSTKVAEESKEMSKVFNTDSTSKDELFKRVNIWAVETFNSAESVLEYRDKENGTIAGKYIFKFKSGIYRIKARQVLRIEIKDFKYRVNFSNPKIAIYGDDMGGTYSISVNYEDVRSQKMMNNIRSEWNSLLTELSASINKETDW